MAVVRGFGKVANYGKTSFSTTWMLEGADTTSFVGKALNDLAVQ